MCHLNKLNIVLLLLGFLSLAADAGRDDLPFGDNDEFFSIKRSPSFIKDYGFISLEGTFDQVKSIDGLHKTLTRLALKSPLSRKPFVSWKAMTSERLVPCQQFNLKIDDPSIRDNIDCNVDGYTVKATTMYKYKLIGDTIKVIANMYPLKINYSKNELARILMKNDVDDTNFIDPNYYGIFFNWQYPVYDEFRCEARMIIALNNSNQHLDNSEMYNLIDELVHLYNRDFVLYLDLKCNIIGEIGIQGDFLLIKQKEFPYLTVTNSFKSLPFDVFFDYEAKVRQKRDHSLQNDETYNTTVDIKSSSNFTPLSFRLEQEFFNKDSLNGEEDMYMAGALPWGIKVKAEWTPEYYVKNVELSLLDYDANGKLKSEGTALLAYYNPANSSAITWSLATSKNVLDRFLSFKHETSSSTMKPGMRDEL